MPPLVNLVLAEWFLLRIENINNAVDISSISWYVS